MHAHMFPLQAYIMQTWSMHRALVKPYKVSLHTFVVQVNKINNRFEQFLPRDDRTPQVKQKCRGNIFDCKAKGQAKFISFCENLKLLDPPKDKAKKEVPTTTSSTANNKQILKKKR
eukprot:11484243-Ditylum_brightwellii.AAC.1